MVAAPRRGPHIRLTDRSLRTLIERRIQKARLEGKLAGLAGEGKPLPERPDNALVSAADAAGFRILAEAGVVPEEIAIKKRILTARATLKTAQDAVARKAAMAELAALELRHGIAVEARRKFQKGQAPPTRASGQRLPGLRLAGPFQCRGAHAILPSRSRSGARR